MIKINSKQLIKEIMKDEKKDLDFNNVELKKELLHFYRLEKQKGSTYIRFLNSKLLNPNGKIQKQISDRIKAEKDSLKVIDSMINMVSKDIADLLKK